MKSSQNMLKSNSSCTFIFFRNTMFEISLWQQFIFYGRQKNKRFIHSKINILKHLYLYTYHSLRNGKIVWKVAWSSITCSWTWVPEDTSTHATSTNIRCKHWMCRKVRIVKATVFFTRDQPFGALIHLNFIMLILICFYLWCLV